MSYIVESGASSSRRARRRRALITLSLVVLMLFFAFWYAYSYIQAPADPSAAAAAPTCPPAATSSAPRPRDTTVNVYNATNRTGLAARTAAEVRKRGFRVATVANDPLLRTIAGPAEVRYGKSGAAKAKLVLALVKGAKAAPDARSDASVDLVLGESFTALARSRATVPVKPTVKPPVKPTVRPTAQPTSKAPAPSTPGASRPTTPAC